MFGKKKEVEAKFVEETTEVAAKTPGFIKKHGKKLTIGAVAGLVLAGVAAVVVKVLGDDEETDDDAYESEEVYDDFEEALNSDDEPDDSEE